MKRRSFLYAMLTIIMMVAFTGCGKDDDDNGTMDVSSIVGTWESEDESIFIFRNDGTGSLSNDDGSNNFEYTYSAKNETLLLMFKGSGKGTEYSVQKTGNILTLSNGNSYIKLKRK